MRFTINNHSVTHASITTPTKGRQLVIPDIHGASDTLQALLKQIGLTQADQLFLLGDYINRGPNNVGVLTQIFQLIENGFQVYPLRGNHEQIAIDSYHNRKSDLAKGLKIYIRRRPRGLVDEQGLLLSKYLDFFSSLPFYYELEDFYLSHAGFDFSSEDPFLDFKQMIWIRDVELPNTQMTHGKRLVRGHVTQPLSSIQKNIQERAPIIHLDNGSYKRSDPEKGNLCCLDLTNEQLYIQQNIEPLRSRHRHS